jgi:hypothetical protein
MYRWGGILMSGQNSWELTIAAPEDAQGLQRVFEDGDFKGGISVKFNRAPNPYQSFQNDGEHIVLPIVKDTATQEILGLGGCVIRKEHVNGNLQNTGYLTGLKILQSHQQKINCIIPAYKLLAKETAKHRPYYYTTILESNKAAVKMLEKRRKNMPSYIYIGKYTVFCFGTGGKASSEGYTFMQGHTAAIAEFYKEHLPKYNLSPKDEWLYGLKSEDFYYLQSPAGEILAVCALWNQQSYKQYIITGYGGIYRPLSRMPIEWFGYPILPKAGAPANYASIAAFIVKDENPVFARLFLKLVLAAAAAYDFVMLGLFHNHPLFSTVSKLRHIKYMSRLYSVDYTRDKSEQLSCGLDNRPVMLEVGLL